MSPERAAGVRHALVYCSDYLSTQWMAKPVKRRPIVNMAASVRARLLNLSKQRRHPLDLLLTRYALERLLYRLSISKYRDRFILKGAMLITSWTEDPPRPTRDLDLLGYGDPSPEAMLGRVL